MKGEINLDELQEFIVESGKNGYAGNVEPKRMPDGSKFYTFQKGDFHYTDNFDGSNQAPGTELVRWQREDGQRIWQMSYSGGMLPEYWESKELAAQTFEFLKRALIKGNNPFRGPQTYNEGNLSYTMKMDGNIKRFSGKEHIWMQKREFNHLIFSQDFIGGLVIPK